LQVETERSSYRDILAGMRTISVYHLLRATRRRVRTAKGSLNRIRSW
jgi:hypothetical protein